MSSGTVIAVDGIRPVSPPASTAEDYEEDDEVHTVEEEEEEKGEEPVVVDDNYVNEIKFLLVNGWKSADNGQGHGIWLYLSDPIYAFQKSLGEIVSGDLSLDEVFNKNTNAAFKKICDERDAKGKHTLFAKRLALASRDLFLSSKSVSFSNFVKLGREKKGKTVLDLVRFSTFVAFALFLHDNVKFDKEIEDENWKPGQAYPDAVAVMEEEVRAAENPEEEAEDSADGDE